MVLRDADAREIAHTHTHKRKNTISRSITVRFFLARVHRRVHDVLPDLDIFDVDPVLNLATSRNIDMLII